MHTIGKMEFIEFKERGKNCGYLVAGGKRIAFVYSDKATFYLGEAQANGHRIVEIWNAANTPKEPANGDH